MNSDRERAVAFLRAHARAGARATVPLRFGFAVLDSALPDVWDRNFVWVDDTGGLDSGELASAADRVLGGAGLAHRQALVADETAGKRLARDLERRGWSTTEHVLMAHRHGPDRPADASADEVAPEQLRTLREDFLREDPSGGVLGPETRRQLVEAAAGTPGRSFAASVDGRLVAGCDLFENGDVAQIESVVTLPGHRNRGLGRAVVLAALEAARARGAGLVFLEAVADDWPVELYAKLGFEPIGRLRLLRHLPAPP